MGCVGYPPQPGVPRGVGYWNLDTQGYLGDNGLSLSIRGTSINPTSPEKDSFINLEHAQKCIRTLACGCGVSYGVITIGTISVLPTVKKILPHGYIRVVEPPITHPGSVIAGDWTMTINGVARKGALFAQNRIGKAVTTGIRHQPQELNLLDLIHTKMDQVRRNTKPKTNLIKLKIKLTKAHLGKLYPTASKHQVHHEYAY